MAFTGNYVCSSFKWELMNGYHDFATTGGDTFKVALYTSTATLNANTSSYTTTGEVASGGGYTTGGNVLTVSASMPTLSGSTVLVDFADVTWTASTITARGALIYNTTPAGGGSNPAIVVLDFLADKTSTASDFTIVFPAASTTRAIIRVT